MNPKFQKLTYLIILICYVVLWFSNNSYLLILSKSSLGIKYIVIDLILISILIIQFFFNTRLIWYLIVVLAIIHFLDTLLEFFITSEMGYIVLILPFYIISSVVLFFLYPYKSNKNDEINQKNVK